MNFFTCWAFLLFITITNGNDYFKDGGCYKMDKKEWTNGNTEEPITKSSTFTTKYPTEKPHIYSTETNTNKSEKISAVKKFQSLWKEMDSRKHSVRYCKEKCSYKISGFSFAGVYDGGYCHCMKSMPPLEDLTSRKECNTSCVFDPTSSCGGQEHMHVYDIFEDSGCYKQNETVETIFWDRIIETESNTVTICIQSCFDGGFKFAGVAFGRYCKCGNKTPARKDLLIASECHFECSGDIKQICGGSWKNNIYKTALNYGEGCFNDNNLGDRILKVNQSKSMSNTEQECREKCSKSGYIFGGLEGGDRCFCGNDVPPAWEKLPLDQCNMPCTGDPKQKCGGDYKIYIFNTIKVGGCYEQKGTESLFEKTIILQNSSVKTCINHCKKSSFHFLGIQEDGCSCGNIPPKIENEESHLKCNGSCPGNQNQTCGGVSSMNVFRIPMRSSILKTEKKSKRLRSQDASTPIVLSIGTAGVVVIIILIFLLLKMKKKLKNSKEEYKRIRIKKLLDGDPTRINEHMPLSEQKSILPYNTEKYEIPKDDIKINHLLGGGQCGDVYLGIVDDTKVAIKKVRDMNDFNQVSSMCDELKILSNIGVHMNLVNLLNASTSEDIYVVLEYCCFGDMKKFLNDNADNFIYNIRYPDNAQENIFTGQLLLKWSYSIAKGMEFLSSKNIMHGDLAARNILLSTNYVPKISDFGLSKVVLYGNEYKKATRRMIPWAWMAIEYLKTGAFHLKSDVWSFGVVLWEMYSLGGKPYDTQPYEEVKVKLVNGERLLSPDYMEQLDENNYMYSNVMLSCFEEEIAKRPNFSDVVGLITGNISKDVLLEYKEMTKKFEMTQKSIKVIKSKMEKELNDNGQTSHEENKVVIDEISKKKEETSKAYNIENITKEGENHYVKLSNINKKKVEDDIDEYDNEFDGYIKLPLNKGKEYSKELSNKLSNENIDDDEGIDQNGSNGYIMLTDEVKKQGYNNLSRSYQLPDDGYVLIQQDLSYDAQNKDMQIEH